MSLDETAIGGRRDEVVFDVARGERIGLEEAVFSAGKSVAQLVAILDLAEADGRAVLLTRFSAAQLAELPQRHRQRLDHCRVSATAFYGTPRPAAPTTRIAIVAAGSTDVPVAREAQRTLRYHGEDATFIADVGVAGLWRLMARLDEIDRHPVVIAVAGMDAALPTVLGGLVGGMIFAVPTSVGYGVATGGRAALDAMLSSCSPGVAVLNIDNGFGAACAALRAVRALRRSETTPQDA